MPHQNTSDQPSASDYSFDGMDSEWTMDLVRECGQTPNLGEDYSIPSSNLADSPTPQPVTLNDTTAVDVDHPGLSFSATNTPHERLQMLTPDAVDQVHQLPLADNLGWQNVVAPHYSMHLFQGLPSPPRRPGAFADAPILSTPSYQQQQQLPGVSLHRAVEPATSPQITPTSSLTHLPQSTPPPRVATNSIRRHPLLANNFRELSQAKQRDLLIQVLHSEWLAANDEEPQDMGRSILMTFLHRANPQALLSCTFDGCTRTFGRQDRAVAHVRQLHLNHKPFACGGACGKRPCNDRFSSWPYLTSHVKKTKATCTKCGKEFVRKNLQRHTTSCSRIK